MSTPTTITTSLERSFQDCSLNHQSTTTGGEETDSTKLNSHPPNSLPSHWEQRLDVKTGEMYYVNLKTGVETKEYPRMSSDHDNNYSDEIDSDSKNNNDDDDDDDDDDDNNMDVLVVGGCRSCLMYYMVPKQLRTCPKCRGQLIRFDRPQQASS